MKKLVVALVVFLVAAPASAGSFTVTTTAQMNAALGVLLEARNAALVQQGKPTMTMEEFVTLEVGHILRGRVDEARVIVRAALLKAIESGDTATEAQLKAKLEALK